MRPLKQILYIYISDKDFDGNDTTLSRFAPRLSLQLEKLLPWPANLTSLRPIGAMQTSNTYVYTYIYIWSKSGSNMCVYVYLYFSISKNAHLQERHEPIGQRSCASAVAASARFAGAEVLPLTSHMCA